MTANRYQQLIDFLTQEVGISTESINIALKSCQQQQGPLPMILWQYGLITLEQLNEVFHWIETSFGPDETYNITINCEK
ncbi:MULTISPECIES: DUF2949 domain-containing protein [Acaryochloris]|uniref:DUF2949 domain-containing protein n=1 Tax=Acaryochloris marina (strain MBIC 11017) TaxID=329726 RepID=B0C176_ACAM1|nr:MULTISPECIES: DUF2949 domain-containing protein [Acaryochloris]ABW28474.1 conserved hypothetical protein [Acaryochloris marina MBIC11017]KAI9135108.1 DUF2949 domain-containing protein [Acaryochloris sp. CCMEE 5410]